MMLPPHIKFQEEHQSQPPVSSPKKRKLSHPEQWGAASNYSSVGTIAAHGSLSLPAAALKETKGAHKFMDYQDSNMSPANNHHMHNNTSPPSVNGNGVIPPQPLFQSNMTPKKTMTPASNNNFIPPPHPGSSSGNNMHSSIPNVPRHTPLRNSTSPSVQMTTSPPPLNFGLNLSRSSSPSFSSSILTGSSGSNVRSSSSTWTSASSASGSSSAHHGLQVGSLSPYGLEHGHDRFSSNRSPLPDPLAGGFESNDFRHGSHLMRHPPNTAHAHVSSSLVLPQQIPSATNLLSSTRSPSPGLHRPLSPSSLASESKSPIPIHAFHAHGRMSNHTNGLAHPNGDIFHALEDDDSMSSRMSRNSSASNLEGLASFVPSSVQKSASTTAASAAKSMSTRLSNGIRKAATKGPDSLVPSATHRSFVPSQPSSKRQNGINHSARLANHAEASGDDSEMSDNDVNELEEVDEDQSEDSESDTSDCGCETAETCYHGSRSKSRSARFARMKAAVAVGATIATAVQAPAHATTPIIATTFTKMSPKNLPFNVPAGVIIATQIPLPAGVTPPAVAKVLTAGPPPKHWSPKLNPKGATDKGKGSDSPPIAAVAVAVAVKRGAGSTAVQATAIDPSSPALSATASPSLTSRSSRGRVISSRGGATPATATGTASTRKPSVANASPGASSRSLQSVSPTVTLSTSGSNSPTIPAIAARSPLKRPLEATYTSSPHQKPLTIGGVVTAHAVANQQLPLGRALPSPSNAASATLAVALASPKSKQNSLNTAAIPAHATASLSSRGGLNARPTVTLPSAQPQFDLSSLDPPSPSQTAHAGLRNTTTNFATAYEAERSASPVSPTSHYNSNESGGFSMFDSHNSHHANPHSRHLPSGIAVSGGAYDPSYSSYRLMDALGNPAHDDGSISTDHFLADHLDPDEAGGVNHSGAGTPIIQGKEGIPETPRTHALSVLMRDTGFQWEGEGRPRVKDTTGAFASHTPPAPALPMLHGGGLIGKTLPLNQPRGQPNDFASTVLRSASPPPLHSVNSFVPPSGSMLGANRARNAFMGPPPSTLSKQTHSPLFLPRHSNEDLYSISGDPMLEMEL